MVIKPDAMNAHELKIIEQVMKENGLPIAYAFNIANYEKLMTKYWKENIAFKNKENPWVELKACVVTIDI